MYVCVSVCIGDAEPDRECSIARAQGNHERVTERRAAPRRFFFFFVVVVVVYFVLSFLFARSYLRENHLPFKIL